MLKRWGQWVRQGVNSVMDAPPLGAITVPEQVWYTMRCKLCGTTHVVKWGVTSAGEQRYRCRHCKATFVDTGAPPGMRYSADVIATTLNLYYEGQSLEATRRSVHLEHAQYPGHATVYEWVTQYTRKAVAALADVKVPTCDLWAADETVLDVAGSRTKEGAENTAWYWDVIDEDTRFLLASHLSQTRTTAVAETLFKRALERATRPPRIIVTDKLAAYQDGIERVFGAATYHMLSEGMRSQSHNNVIERFHGTLKDRTKVMRGMASMETAKLITDGWLVHYNFFRPHLGLNGRTPAQVAGVEAPFTSWRDVVKEGWGA